MKAVRLGPQHAAPLQAFLRDCREAGEEWIHGYFVPWDAPHGQAVADLEAWSSGEGLRAGWVPCTTGFIEAEGELLGVFNVRHELSDALRDEGGHIGYHVRPSARGRGVGHACLAGGLEVCRALGIRQALLTCDPTNVASWKVIEGAGGLQIFEGWSETKQGTIRRYHVPVPA